MDGAFAALSDRRRSPWRRLKFAATGNTCNGYTEHDELLFFVPLNSKYCVHTGTYSAQGSEEASRLHTVQHLDQQRTCPTRLRLHGVDRARLSDMIIMVNVECITFHGNRSRLLANVSPQNIVFLMYTRTRYSTGNPELTPEKYSKPRASLYECCTSHQ